MNRLALVLALAWHAHVAAAPAGAPVTLRYVYIAQTRPSGQATLTIEPDGTRRIDTTILENGRGPACQATIRYAADGTLARFDATGHDWLFKDAPERFAIEAGRASWSNLAEEGERAVTGPAFYIPFCSELETAAGLVRALGRAGGHLALLPAGEARLETLGERKITAGGKSVTLVGHAITGLELPPVYLWLEHGEVFAALNQWGGWMREGFTEAIPVLVAAQNAHTVARAAERARKLGRRFDGGFAITHARVLAASGKAWLPDHTVVVRGGSIAAVGPSARLAPPAGAEVIDAEGKALLPGLWDMHFHLGSTDGELMVASGVTTVRDTGNNPDELDPMRARFDAGEEIGPTVIPAGLIEGRGENAAASKITAETEAEAIAAVEFYARRGYPQIKIYNSVRPELVPILAREAHARGMRVSGHVPVHMRAEEAIRAGYDEVTHLNMLFLNFFIDRDTDTRTTLRFSIVGEKAAGLDLGSPRVRAFLALLRKKGTVIDPTLVAFEDLFLARPRRPSEGARRFMDRLPVNLRRRFLSGGLPIAPEQEQRYRDSFRAMLALVKRLHDLGVPIVAGTDAFAGGLSLTREIELYVEAGLAPWEAIRAATAVPAHVMNRPKKGTIAPGNDADLILVDGDPLQRIGDLRRVVSTVKGGTLYASPELYQAVGVLP